MIACRIYHETHDVDARLVPFGVTRQELIEVVKGVVGARADAVENDPVTAEGQFAYIYGTRFTRALFRTKGWHLHRKDNIEAVRHPERELRVIYQSVDLAASRHHRPQAVSGKGSAADRQISEAQGDLFAKMEAEAAHAVRAIKFDTGIWYLCVSVDGDDVCAELSLPTGVEGGNFQGFVERIFILQDGEWPELMAKGDDVPPAEFEPEISRK